MARISRKARPLRTSGAPVVLAIAVPAVESAGLLAQFERLDLAQLSWAATALLTWVSQVSAVLPSLWDVEPLPERSSVRPVNIYAVERSTQQSADPRICLLIMSPAAGYPLSHAEIWALNG